MNGSAREDVHILVSGDNCWKVEEAEQVSFLVDADAYFYAFRESAKLARKNIYICGWDIDSRMILLREDQDDGYPLELGEFLNALANEKEDLHIYILIWDFVRFMGIDREWFSQLKLGWKAHENIHFQLDQLYPVGASIHHKLIVIDDAISFVGGLDLTKERWDTPRHRPDSKRRRTFDGRMYRPHHDVQIMLAGKPSQDLGTYFRNRWERVTGQKISPEIPDAHRQIWPQSIEVNTRQCTLGIARTQAEYEDLPGIFEVEQLYLDSIEKARNYIYIENQYLTANKIIKALSQSLQQAHGPEVIIVLPYSTDGWLSQNTMDLLRAGAVDRLRKSDKHDRLEIYYAYQDGLEGDDTIKVHSKVMIIDDRFARIGSSNLNNRSMGFDAECDVAIEMDQGSGKTEAIQSLLYTLLAEHLGVKIRDVRESIKRSGSVLNAIEDLRGNSRSLEKLEVKVTDTVEYIREGQIIFDPERPIEPGRFLKLWSPEKDISRGGFKYVKLAIFFIVLIGLALAWRYSSLQEFSTTDKLKELATILSNNELAWLYVLCAFAIGSVLMVPITLLISLTILVFGVYKGFVLALIGSVLSGAITYWGGRLLGRETVRTLAGDKINTVSQKLGKSGIMSTFLIRLMPIAPYSVVNIVAGASHIRFRDFIVGTFLGMLPGTLAIAGIFDRGYALVTNPDGITILSTIIVVAVIIGAVLFIRKKIQ